MRPFNFKLVVLFSIIAFSVTAQNSKKTITTDGGERCGFIAIEKKLQSKHSNRLNNTEFENWIAPKIKETITKRLAYKTANTIITIPVVVHVIHNGDDYGVNENITDSQIESQLTVLTEDFRRMYGTPGYNDNPVGADLEIEFVLAKQTPEGCPTNGINRLDMEEEDWSIDDIEDILKPATIWDPTQYMNIWTVNFSRSDLLGYAQFPSSSQLDGLEEDEGDADTDGVVCNYNTFGSEDYDDGTFVLQATYNKGRTMTHEVGHFFGLRHIWGDGDCTVDDYVDDTPLAGSSHSGCPVADTCTDDSETEPVYDMVENYMDYTNDECMNIFTEGQKERTLTVLENSPRRKGLVTSNKDEAPVDVDNDPSIELASIEAPACGTEIFATIELTNYGTTTLTSLIITSEIEGETSEYNWTGSLASNQTIDVTLPGVTASGISQNITYNINISNPNGETDARTCNNTISKDYTISTTVLASETATSIILNLKTDSYASETTWALLDSSDQIVETGGEDYLDNTSYTETLEINADECYTFIMYDEDGDGIIGDGYYTLSTADDIIYTAGTFTYEDKVNISTKTLSISNKEFTNYIKLYPNPTKDILNIAFSYLNKRPTQYSIYNILGQVIKQNEFNTTTELSINTTGLQGGMYFIKLSNSTNSATLRFIKK